MIKIALAVMAVMVALVGCATGNAPSDVMVPSNITSAQDGQPAYVQNTPTDQPQAYMCQNTNDGRKLARIIAKYYPQADTALVNISALQLGLNNANVEMKRVISGSGDRYINDTNPASIYEWHIKGGEGVLTVSIGRNEYEYHCMKSNNHR